MVYMQIVIEGLNSDLKNYYPTNLKQGRYNVTITDISYYEENVVHNEVMTIRSEVLRGQYGNNLFIAFPSGYEAVNAGDHAIQNIQCNRRYVLDLSNYIDIEITNSSGATVGFGANDFCIIGMDITPYEDKK